MKRSKLLDLDTREETLDFIQSKKGVLSEFVNVEFVSDIVCTYNKKTGKNSMFNFDEFYYCFILPVAI